MAWLVAPGGELHHTGARSPTLSPAQFGAAMGPSSGLTVLIILPAFLLHTSGLYIASSVGTYSGLQLNVASVYVAPRVRLPPTKSRAALRALPFGSLELSTVRLNPAKFKKIIIIYIIYFSPSQRVFTYFFFAANFCVSCCAARRGLSGGP